MYKKRGIDALPRSLWWITNNAYLLTIFLFLLVPMCFLLIEYKAVSALPFALWGITVLFIYLYANRNPRPCRIELGGKAITFTCSRFFSVHDVSISYEDLQIELYKNKYFRGNYSGFESERYLYFSSATDKNVWIEITAPFYTLGEIIEALSKDKNILLGERELNFLSSYRKQLEADKTPGGRLSRILWPLIFIALVAFLVYKIFT